MPATQPTKRRITVVTGGGDAPGINAVLRAFVHGVAPEMEVFGARFGFEGLTSEGGTGILPMPVASVRGILHEGGSILGCSTHVYPFGPGIDLGAKIRANLERIGAEALVLIGGDGTMNAAQKLIALGIPCIGIPKTIDNDMGGTDQTFGFDTAVDTATRAIDALHSTAESHRRVMILEVMGRNAGFIALHSAMAGGADIVLIPEIPYDVDRIVAKIEERDRLGLRFSIIVIAEGACCKAGEPAEIEKARPGHLPRLGGAGERLANEIHAKHAESEVRVTVLGHLQRGGSPSALDRVLGTRFGAKAASLCVSKHYGRMVSLRGTDVTSLPIAEALAETKRVDPDGEFVRAARDIGMELGA